MSPAPQTPLANPAPPAPTLGISVDDILFTLFRHKWLILAFFSLGAIGAVGVRLIRPPNYYSRAKLLMPFDVDKPPGPAGEGVVHMPENGGASVLNNEIEILYSHDVASNAVRTIGADKIMAK